MKPRSAAKAVFVHMIALEYRGAYCACFLEKLRGRLGPPASSREPARLRPPGAGWASSHAASQYSLVRMESRDAMRYDAFLSHRQKESQDTVARVHDKLTASGYRAFIDRNDLVELTGMKLAVRQTVTFVAFLSATYFESAACCLEICEAAEREVPVILVLVEGALWGGKPFPSLDDIPESITVQDEELIVELRPRQAAEKIFASAPRLDHTRNYFDAFVDALTDALGPPPAVETLQGEAREVWKRAGGGVTVPWAALQEQLHKAGGPAFEAFEPLVAQALGVRALGAAPMATTAVTAAAFASLFPAEAGIQSTMETLSRARGDEERVLHVEVVPGAEDGGLALVGRNTSLEEVRSQLIEAHANDEDDVEDDVPAAREERLAGPCCLAQRHAAHAQCGDGAACALLCVGARLGAVGRSAHAAAAARGALDASGRTEGAASRPASAALAATQDESERRLSENITAGRFVFIIEQRKVRLGFPPRSQLACPDRRDVSWYNDARAAGRGGRCGASRRSSSRASRSASPWPSSSSATTDRRAATRIATRAWSPRVGSGPCGCLGSPPWLAGVADRGCGATHARQRP